MNNKVIWIISIILLFIIIIIGFYNILEKKEISEEEAKKIFYNSRCYKEDVGEIKDKVIEFKINKLDNVEIKKTKIIYKFERGNFTEVRILATGDSLLTPSDYVVIEKQNATVWRVQGGIFSNGFGGSFHGCLEFVDEESGEILAQGWYGYT